MTWALLKHTCAYAFLHNCDCEDEACSLSIAVDRELIKDGELFIHTVKVQPLLKLKIVHLKFR